MRYAKILSILVVLLILLSGNNQATSQENAEVIFVGNVFDIEWSYDNEFIYFRLSDISATVEDGWERYYQYELGTQELRSSRRWWPQPEFDDLEKDVF